MILCLDVGGTEIKAAPVSETGELLCTVKKYPAKAALPKEALLNHFAEIMEDLAGEAKERSVCGIHLAFPGPFDYENGISLLRGLDKYDALYGENLRRELKSRLNFPELLEQNVKFINDVSAFAKGEMKFGAAAGFRRCLFVCIGTGCGSAFGMDGQLCDGSEEGVPKDGYLYPLPYRDGCMDDYFSRRGLERLTKEMLGTSMDGKMLSKCVQNGRKEAKRCFLTFGEMLCEALSPVLNDFHPDCLCVGGQITKSADFFLQPLCEFCRKSGIFLYVTENTSVKTIQGLSTL